MTKLRMMLLPGLAAAVLAFGGVSLAVEPVATLRPTESFAGIVDPIERSAALFNEAMKVISHPRCLNCHPVTRVPTQGDGLRPHMPPVNATETGIGPAGLSCQTCHQAQNVATYAGSIASIPGHPHWHLAPAEMGWQGRSAAAICAQIKDPARNGNRTPAMLHEHMATDTLVGWAWHPGEGRAPAPGTQAAFGNLIAAWIATGAACPRE